MLDAVEDEIYLVFTGEKERGAASSAIVEADSKVVAVVLINTQAVSYSEASHALVNRLPKNL